MTGFKDLKLLHIIFYILSVQIIICSVFTGHYDVYEIVTWGIKLLDAFFSGNITEYAEILKAMNMPTNYSFSTNLLTSIILLPCYAVLHYDVTHNSIFYIIFYKLVIAVTTIFASTLVGKIALKFNFNSAEAELAKILYLSSFFVQPISVLFGQVDFIGNFFLIYGIYFLLDNKFKNANWMFALSLCGKPFSAIIIIPIYCITFFRFKKIIFSSLFALFLPVVLCNLFAFFFVKNYFINGQEISQRFNFYENLVSHDHYIIFILCSILCFIFFLKSKKICYDNRKIITYPLLVFALFATQEIHHSWELYEAAPVTILCLLIFRINPILGVSNYFFICFLQFFKYFTVGAVDSYYTRIFDAFIFRSNIDIHFWNILAYYFGIFNAYPFRLIYLATIFFLVFWVNSKKNEMALIFNRYEAITYNRVGIIYILPIVCYFIIVFSFISFK